MLKSSVYPALMLLAVCLPGGAAAQRYDDYDSHEDPPQYWSEAPDRPQERGYALLRSAMLQGHNDARRAVRQPPLRWNSTLAADAERYAKVLARTRTFQHSREPRGAKPQGENLWMGSTGQFGYAEMIGSWVDERRWFRRAAMPKVSTTGRWADVGHYTQIVWNSTTDVGCAIADNGRDEYLVCRYGPPGNVYGRDPLGGDEQAVPKRTGS